MKSIITLGIVLTFSILFTTSSGVLKGQAFASIEEGRYNSYYPDEYSQYDKQSSLSIPSESEFLSNILKGVDEEQLEEIGDKLFEGIDKERLLNNAQNLLNNFDFEELNEQLLQEGNDDSTLVFIPVLLLISMILFLIIWLIHGSIVV